MFRFVEQPFKRFGVCERLIQRKEGIIMIPSLPLQSGKIQEKLIDEICKTRKNAGFVNEPTSLDSYYKLYPNKKYNPNNTSAN